MPPTLVTVWFDYACPHSYIGLGQLEELALTRDLEINRTPFLMRASSPGSIQGSRIQMRSESMNDEGNRRQPLYKPGEGSWTEPASNRSVSTLLVHAATALAKEQGLDGQFFWVASKGYWEQGVDLGNLYTLRRVSVSVGLDWPNLLAKLESGGYHDLVLAQHEEAKRAGVVQTPSFRIGGNLHSGNLSFEKLRTAVQAAA